MTWMPALKLAQLKTSEREKIKIGGQDILLIWHQDAVHAIQSQCPHLKLPLMKGTLTKECEIVCPFHKSAFSLKTGNVACWSPWPPVIGKLLGKLSKEKALKIYPTRIKDDQIWVEV